MDLGERRRRVTYAGRLEPPKLIEILPRLPLEREPSNGLG
jgi:hypothetical protein